MKFFILLCSFLAASPLCAAYRVYQLKVRSFDERSRPQKTAVVLSNLDPQQYEHYHSGYGRMIVNLVDTWYCPGDTSGKAYCKKPKVKQLQRGPAGLFAPKRELDFNRQPVIP